MRSATEIKAAYAYGVFLVLILGMVTVFLLCDFQVLPAGICKKVETGVKTIGKGVNRLTGAQ